MRIQTLILSLLLCVTSAFAKDVITKTDGTKLDAKVEEITESVIKYRKASNPTGPLYTVPITSVATVLYENGDIDSFNTPISTSEIQLTQSSTMSDDDLMRMADADLQAYSNQAGNVSDAQLLRMAKGKTDYEELESRAKKYKKIGWYGGGFIFAAGLATGLGIWNSWSWDGGEDFAICGSIMAASLVGAYVWCLGFNLKARSLMKQARQMQSYSSNLIENEILKFGDNSLTAGINLMGNRIVHSHSLGVSLGVTF